MAFFIMFPSFRGSFWLFVVLTPPSVVVAAEIEKLNGGLVRLNALFGGPRGCGSSDGQSWTGESLVPYPHRQFPLRARKPSASESYTGLRSSLRQTVRS